VKRLFLLVVGVVAFFAIQFLANCSQPLDSTSDPGFSPPGTTIIVDTVIIVDTTFQVDTVIVVDTVTNVDTIIVVQPDPGGLQTVCSQLSSCHRKILWMFRNQAGLYHLEFVAESEKEHPSRTLYVEIDDQWYKWRLSDSSELIIDQYLEENASIRIITGLPLCFGHAIDICLTVSTL